MILADCNGFPRAGRVLGIDWGARRVGVAVSDASREFVFVRDVVVLARGEDAAPKIANIAREEEAVGIVIGLPVHSDGAESETAALVRRCAQNISELLDLPILFVPENLTSVAAQESMGRVRIRDIKEKLDSEAARVILENAIAIIRRCN